MPRKFIKTHNINLVEYLDHYGLAILPNGHKNVFSKNSWFHFVLFF